MFHAAVEQLAGVGGIRAALLRARPNALFQVVKGEARHRFCSPVAYHLCAAPQISPSAAACETPLPGGRVWRPAQNQGNAGRLVARSFPEKSASSGTML